MIARDIHTRTTNSMGHLFLTADIVHQKGLLIVNHQVLDMQSKIATTTVTKQVKEKRKRSDIKETNEKLKW